MADSKKKVTKKKITTPRKSGKKNTSALTGLSKDDQRLLLMSALNVRAGIAARLGKSYSDDRDLYTALGYPETPSFTDYQAKYYRQDIAGAIVDLPVRESWRKPPTLSEGQEEETAFEKAWVKLVKDRKLFHYFSRIDRIASLGTYGVLFLGFDDQGEQNTEVTRARQLLYLMPYTQANATMATYEIDTKNERYGRPVEYDITRKSLGTGKAAGLSSKVHWSRVLHVAEDCLEDDVEGQPRLRPIFNRLYDLAKLAGGSAEMFWRGAFPGYGFKLDEGHSLGDQDLSDLQDELEEYMHGLKRYIRLRGMSVEALAMQVADPSSHIEVQIDLICASRRIPKRILLGSERGELASTQDKVAWAAVIEARQKEHCEPMILRPLVDRLITLGVLPSPKEDYTVEWPDLLAPGDKEKAEVGKIRSESIKNYANAPGADMIVPPEMFYKKVLDLTDEEIKQIDEILDTMLKKEEAGVEEVPVVPVGQI